jgi:hypothetical protein
MPNFYKALLQNQVNLLYNRYVVKQEFLSKSSENFYPSREKTEIAGKNNVK